VITDALQSPTDDDIHQHLGAGRFHEAFEGVVERYARKVFHLAYSMLRNETQAEDTTQDILVKIWKGLPGYHAQASISTWIYTIARNTCLTELKKRSNRPTVSIHEPELEHSLEGMAALQTNDPESGAGMDVNSLVEQLPVKYRQVITLYYLEQKSYEEVASLLGIPLGTVKTFLHRAKRELLRMSSRKPDPRILAAN
jgi:RNA polymerase sigma-70 factor (ECF subfamily)